MSQPLPPIYRDCRRLLVHTEAVVQRFSRYHKYTVGTDLRQQAMALMRGMHVAVYDRPNQARHVQARAAIDFITCVAQSAERSPA